MKTARLKGLLLMNQGSEMESKERTPNGARAAKERCQ